MKRTYRPPIWLALLLIATIFLAACVRPVPGRDVTPTVPAQATIPAESSPLASPAGITPGPQATLPAQITATPGVDTTQPTATTGPAATATVPAPTATPGVVQPPPTQPPVSGGEQTYTVQRGDNLFRIGLRFGCHYTVLAQYNGIPNPHAISVGQVIRIPADC